MPRPPTPWCCLWIGCQTLCSWLHTAIRGNPITPRNQGDRRSIADEPKHERIVLCMAMLPCCTCTWYALLYALLYAICRSHSCGKLSLACQSAANAYACTRQTAETASTGACFFTRSHQCSIHRPWFSNLYECKHRDLRAASGLKSMNPLVILMLCISTCLLQYTSHVTDIQMHICLTHMHLPRTATWHLYANKCVHRILGQPLELKSDATVNLVSLPPSEYYPGLRLRLRRCCRRFDTIEVY